MIAQQKDAEAVIATLWDVNDASTSRLMSDFYARWVKHPADGKGGVVAPGAACALMRGGAIRFTNLGRTASFKTRAGATSTVAAHEPAILIRFIGRRLF